MSARIKPEDLIEERIGHIYSEEGVYEPDMITFTVERGRRIEIGDIVCIKHPSMETLVFYQVIEVPVRRKARDYEEDLVRLGYIMMDDTRNYPRARAKQIGYVDDLGKLMTGETSIDYLMMLIEHITPLSEVYRPKPEVIDKLLSPNDDSIVVGKIYPGWKHEYKFNLQRLLRQGLLVVGGVGTGKTTTMLTILYRTLKAFIDKGGKPHVLIIDKDGEYGTDEIINLVGKENYIHVNIDDIGSNMYLDSEQFYKDLLHQLGITAPQSGAARALKDTIMEIKEKALLLTPEFVEKKIIEKLRKKNYGKYYIEILNRFNTWKKHYEQGMKVESKYTINEILALLNEKMVVHIDLSECRDFNRAYKNLNTLLKMIYDEALNNDRFGAIIVIDEAHLYAPEKGGIALASDDKIAGALKDTLHLIATTGPRNGVTPFIATQRPSLISKTITTQMGQNIIAHRVEDVDLVRIEEIMGDVARRVRVLPRGWAIVKGLAAKIREPLIVKIEAETYPKSTGKTAYERFLSTGQS
jgi:DNA helicase HerA-like ATPase